MGNKKNGFNRREFLKILGATTGIAATGCSKELPEKIIPYVISPDETVPGVANWYSGTCDECQAGCGIIVRSREGRAVKVEGNPQHPINMGGLCARGQSSLQALYDPDRVREPLVRELGGSFSPKTWDEALTKVSKAMSEIPADEEVVIVTPPVSGSIENLIGEFKKAFPAVRHIEFDLLGRNGLDRATEICFGESTRVHYNFEKANTIVSFGADYLETWFSPVEFSRQWAARRLPKKDGAMSYCVHFEPRLSLTAANADKWVKNQPNSEYVILLALLKAILSEVGSGTFDNGLRRLIDGKIDGKNLDKLLEGTNVEPQLIENLAKTLVQSRPSLVLAGGASVSGSNELPCMVLSLVINAVLGNIGSTVAIEQSKRSVNKSGVSELVSLCDVALNGAGKKVGMLITAGVNPAFSLPNAAKFREALAKMGTVVSFSLNLDETANLANVVLPLSHSLEAWGDSEPALGVYNLSQPAMQPLYGSQSIGDSLIAIAGKLNVRFGETSSFYDYLRVEWKKRLGENDFENKWLEVVEKGGKFESKASPAKGYILQTSGLKSALEGFTIPELSGLRLLAYPTVNASDGKFANRPWLQELPNPITTTVWGSWAEIHPDTAATLGIEKEGVLRVSTQSGSIDVPVYITRNISKNLVAVPIGQGHKQFGRYANGIGANPLSILPIEKSAESLLSLSVPVTLARSTWVEDLVKTQGHDSQEKRELLQVVPLTQFASDKKSHGNAHHGEHDIPKDMYKQMEHPLYKWGMSVDLSRCTGCSACVVACYAENNVPVVGKELCLEGREMSWIRIERYMIEDDDQPVEGFLPMMCQHCGHAPCEPVCPVYATYHSEDGLNAMVYNRCVGTRYCANNCSYKVRRFNWFHYTWPEPLNMQLNPDVTVREVGVMEKCTFCVQRIREATNRAKDLGRPVIDGEVQPACASSCPTKAIKFGNLKDKKSVVSHDSHDKRAYKVLDHHLNTQPAISYLQRIKNDSVKLT